MEQLPGPPTNTNQTYTQRQGGGKGNQLLNRRGTVSHQKEEHVPTNAIPNLRAIQKTKDPEWNSKSGSHTKKNGIYKNHTKQKNNISGKMGPTQNNDLPRI